jgi:hypothetical protein
MAKPLVSKTRFTSSNLVAPAITSQIASKPVEVNNAYFFVSVFSLSGAVYCYCLHDFAGNTDSSAVEEYCMGDNRNHPAVSASFSGCTDAWSSTITVRFACEAHVDAASLS